MAIDLLFRMEMKRNGMEKNGEHTKLMTYGLMVNGHFISSIAETIFSQVKQSNFEFKMVHRLSNKFKTLFGFRSHTNYYQLLESIGLLFFPCKLTYCEIAAGISKLEFHYTMMPTMRYWCIIIIGLCTILFIWPYLPHQISSFCVSL